MYGTQETYSTQEMLSVQEQVKRGHFKGHGQDQACGGAARAPARHRPARPLLSGFL